MICRYCGYENADANRCCSRCGRRLGTAAAAESRGWAPQEAQKKTYAQLASEADARKREEHSHRQEDGRTCAGIAAMIAAAAFLFAGVSAGAYAWISGSAAAQTAAEMNYAASSAEESTEEAAAAQTEEGTPETVQASQAPQETEVPAQPSESDGEDMTAAEAVPVPGASPAPDMTEEASEDVAQDASEDAAQDAPAAEHPEYTEPYADQEPEEYYDPAQEQDDMDPYGDSWSEPYDGTPYEDQPYDESQEVPEADGNGPGGFMWDMITRFYSIGAEAA